MTALTCALTSSKELRVGPVKPCSSAPLQNFTVRDGDMKLVMIERTETRDVLPRLFDLASDRGETRNLPGGVWVTVYN